MLDNYYWKEETVLDIIRECGFKILKTVVPTYDSLKKNQLGMLSKKNLTDEFMPMKLNEQSFCLFVVAENID